MCMLLLVCINNFHNIVYIWVNFKVAYTYNILYNVYYDNNNIKTLVQATAIDKI